MESFESMEALLYFFGMSSYFSPEVERTRHNLVCELKEKLHHAKRVESPSYRVLSDTCFQDDLKEVTSLVSLAENPLTAPYVLASLAEHINHEVRMAAADNISLPFSAQQKLAEDEHLDVRYRLAEGYHISPILLSKLADDENPYVSARAAETLARLAQMRS